MVDALLLRPLPYPHPDRLAAIWLHSPGIGILRDWPSPGQYIDIQNQNHSFEQMALAQSRTFTLTGREQPERVDVLSTQSSLLDHARREASAGPYAAAGRGQAGQTAPSRFSATASGSGLFNSDPAIVGKSITLNGNPFTVAGVLQRSFVLNAEVMPSEGPMDKVDIFLPLPLGADAAQRRGDENYNIMVRLKPGVSVQQAQADIDVIASRIREKDKRDASFGMDVVGLAGAGGGRCAARAAGAAGLGGAGAADRLRQRGQPAAAARGGPRERSRHPHGFGSGLAAAGAAIVDGEHSAGTRSAEPPGCWSRELSLYVVRTMNPGNIPRLEDIAINGAVLAFTFGVSLATGMLFGAGAGVARHQAGPEHVAESRRAQRAEPMAVCT